MPRDVVGAILAGGRSSRMGADKAQVELAGRPLAEWVAAALTPLPTRIVVGRAAPLAGLPAYRDGREGGRGPLLGLETAFAASHDEDVLLVAVDQPFVRAETVRRIASREGGDAVVPVDNGVLQTTCALYRRQCESIVTDLLDVEGSSLQDLLAAVEVVRIEPTEWQSWGEDGRSWFSVDTPQSLAAAERKFR